nr:sensor histidine kinase [Fredinandcohnia sp. SECRCQ15]
MIYRAVIVVSLVIIGLYHVVLFLFRKKELSFLFFAIVCMSVAIRATILEEGLASNLLSFLSWEIACKLEYMGAALGTLFIALFTNTQFPKEMHRTIRTMITIALSSYSVFVIVTPAVIFTQTMVLLQILIVLVFLYILYVYLLAALQKREGYLLNSVATFILFLLVLNDILFYNQLIHTTELTSVGLFFFLFTQAIILSKKYSRSFTQAEHLSEDLKRLNSSLEEQVKRRTIELEKTNKELYCTNQKLKDSQQSKNKWIRNISHEISAPLTNIRSYSKGMIDDVIPPDKKYLQLIYDQSLYFSRMLNDLNDISEMENNQIKFHLEKCNIQEYLHEIYEKYKWNLEKQGIKFSFKNLIHQQVKEQYVLIDSTRIEQVIVNLLTNAQRFVMDEGEITLELAMDREDTVTIRVRDNGIGMTADNLSKVFNRFYKNSNQGKPHNGAGLGLPISKEIIEYHNGKISVESTLGEGSCFNFTLPMDQGDGSSGSENGI